MHAFRKPILCKLLSCRAEFVPKRKNQIFCSKKCRQRYFSVARALGIKLIEKCRVSQSWRAVGDRLLKEPMDQTANHKRRRSQIKGLREAVDREN